jgi:hypothetical protein
LGRVLTWSQRSRRFGLVWNTLLSRNRAWSWTWANLAGSTT